MSNAPAVPLSSLPESGNSNHRARRPMWTIRPGWTRGLALGLLAALIAGSVLLADRLIEHWADEHLLAAWLLMWLVVALSFALFFGTAQRLARGVMTRLDAWSHQRAQRRAEARMWRFAQSDPRLMAELMQARQRAAAPTTVSTPLARAIQRSQAKPEAAPQPEDEPLHVRRGRVLAQRYFY